MCLGDGDIKHVVFKMFRNDEAEKGNSYVVKRRMRKRGDLLESFNTQNVMDTKYFR